MKNKIIISLAFRNSSQNRCDGYQIDFEWVLKKLLLNQKNYSTLKSSFYPFEWSILEKYFLSKISKSLVKSI